MRVPRLSLALLALLASANVFAQQASRDREDCDALKMGAVPLSSKEALKNALSKGLPPAKKMDQGARIEWTVLVNQDGVIQCVLDNSPAESWGRLDLMLVSMKALGDWKFKPYVLNGQRHSFITKLSFVNDGGKVSVE